MKKHLANGGPIVIDPAATIGDKVIVPAVPGKRIVLTALVLSAHGAQTIQWESNSINKSGPVEFADTGGLVCLGDGTSHIGIESEIGQDLVLNLTAAIKVGGWGYYGLSDV